MSFHELFRYSYPIEPYANFRHENPKLFLEKLSSKLLNFAHSSDCLTLYNLNDINIHKKEINNLPQKTSKLYISQWKKFGREELLNESKKLLLNRIPQSIFDEFIKNKNVLDFGCGSGRYSLALKLLGAKKVTALDYNIESAKDSIEISKNLKLDIEFLNGDIPNLNVDSLGNFDFIFSNGVLHHTYDWRKSLDQYLKLTKKAGYLYLYANHGYFWNIRKVARKVFSKIPKDVTQEVLDNIGLPRNRFIFMDTFYVPVEAHINRKDLLDILKENDFKYKQLISKNEFDILGEFALSLPDFYEVFGEAEHRYLVQRN